MFFDTTKKKFSYHTLSLLVCALFLAGIGYAFVQNLENLYQTQARIALNQASSSIAHYFSTNLIESQEYVDLLAHIFEKNSSEKEESIEENLKNIELISEKYPFIGIITEKHQLFVGSQSGATVRLDTKTKDMLLQAPKEHPTYGLAYINGVGIYYLFYTSPITLKSGEKGVLFTGRKHSRLREKILPQQMRKHIRYAIIDAQGIVLEDTFSNVSLGENILLTWGSDVNNSTEIMQQIRQNLASAKPNFAKISYNGIEYFLDFAPTPQQQWTVMVSVTQDTVQKRLERITYTMIIIGAIWFIFCIAMLAHILRIERREKLSTVNNAKRLQRLFDEIPAGVARFKENEELTVIEYGKSFLDTFDLTVEELEKDHDNSWLSLILPEDRSHVQQTLHEAFDENSDTAIIEYRIQPKGKDIMWVLETTRIMHDQDERWYWSIFTNTTERKEKQIHDQKIAERYRYLFETSDKILYEYDWNTLELRTTRPFFKKFGYTLPTEKSDYYLMDVSIIHTDDMDLFNSMQAKLKAGGTAAEALLRIKKADESWAWCQLSQSVWVDMSDNTTKAIGEIKNVDEETRSLQKLRDDVQRDTFTGLYNKTATADLIKQEIARHQDERGVLCIIDVDNFKQVNDNLGHAVGDIVIKNLASGLASIFRSDDIVGRVGGDEYIVYIKNMPNLGVLLVKLDKVLEFFNQKLEGEGVTVNISCSIGIALFPSDGDNYQDIYMRADKALYRSKKKKGIYTFYDSKIDM